MVRQMLHKVTVELTPYDLHDGGSFFLEKAWRMENFLSVARSFKL